jgi:hypothetical protein
MSNKALTLSIQALTAALAEQVYRRNDLNFRVTDEDLRLRAITGTGYA